MNLGFSFDSDFGKLTEDNKAKSMELTHMHMVQASTDAELNFKIASVKKVSLRVWIFFYLPLIVSSKAVIISMSRCGSQNTMLECSTLHHHFRPPSAITGRILTILVTEIRTWKVLDTFKLRTSLWATMKLYLGIQIFYCIYNIFLKMKIANFSPLFS